MNFLALLLGLGLERVLTRLLHLREFRWLDPLFDRVFRGLGPAGPSQAQLTLLLVALGLAAPVLAGTLLLAAGSQGLGSFLFGIVVLLFSLGPRDLSQEVEEYCEAARRQNDTELARLGRELVECEVSQDRAIRLPVVERAIYLQANNRIFGVVFWFLVLGPAAPAGAWLFRVADLMRRRAAFTQPQGAALDAARSLHGLLAWVPARLMVGAFPLTGSFESAAAAWPVGKVPGRRFHERTDKLVADVGQGARGMLPETTAPADGLAEAAVINSAIGMVRRTLWLIWYPAIALLTLGNLLQ